jgi:cell migration-inducing and hyaluronan-binding protein
VNAKRVYFPPMEKKWGNDNLSGVAWKAAAFHDKDGSVTGTANSYVIIHDGVFDNIATDTTACEIRRDWNAAVCKGDIGRLTFGGPGGPPRAAPAAARGDAPSSLGAGAPITAAGPGGAPAGGPPGAGVRPPPQPPVVLSRNGREYNTTNTNVRAGTEIKVTTARPSVNLNLTELDAGSWVIFELPGFTTAASGTEQTSLDALRKASATSYYKDKDSLWVKVVSNGDSARGTVGFGPGSGTSLQVSR